MRRGLLVGTLALVAACAGGDTPGPAEPGPTEPPGAPAVPPPSDPTPPLPIAGLRVVVRGLPDGARASVTVRGPVGTRLVDATTRLDSLPIGDYAVEAAPVTVGGDRWLAAPAVQIVTVGPAGTVRDAIVSYRPPGAAVALVGDGLPSYARGPIRLTLPDGSERDALTGDTLVGLPTGAVRGVASAVETTDGRFEAVPSERTAELVEETITTLAFTYAPPKPALTVTVNGLPAGAPAGIEVRGPAGFVARVDSTRTLEGLQPGTYVGLAARVRHAGFSWDPSRASADALLAPSQRRTMAFTYALASGAIAVSALGLPAGVDAAIRLTGPDGVERRVAGTQTLTDLPPGTYRVTAQNVTAEGVLWRPTPAATDVTVAASLVATPLTVTYDAPRGDLELQVGGLPETAVPSVRVAGPFGFERTLTGTSVSLSGLVVGRYRITADTIDAGDDRWRGAPREQEVTVAARDTTRTLVTYALATGRLAVGVGGLPTGVEGDVRVDGPGGDTRVVQRTAVLTRLLPGSYVLRPQRVVAGGIGFDGTPSPAAVTVEASPVVQSAAVTYVAATGRLVVRVAGLPTGAAASVTVDGPGGFRRLLTATDTLDDLTPGTYVVAAAAVTNRALRFLPDGGARSVTIAAGATGGTDVTYVADGDGIDLAIDAAYLTQAIQRPDGSVPLVSGRDALLRVFVRADTVNALTPDLRVRLAQGGAVYRTITLPAPTTGVPVTTSEATLAGTWNVRIPATDIRLGMSVTIEVDPTDAIAEPDEANNRWPRAGAFAPTVRTVPPLDVHVFPVLQTANGLVGNVTPSNVETLFATTRSLWPITELALTLRNPFTTNAPALDDANVNGAWLTVLGELEALRVSEGVQGRHVVGIVSTAYTSGIAGVAYEPGFTALSWDRPASAGRVLAHELGHNFGRAHVAACGTGTTDAGYPHAGGRIGGFGWDPVTGAVVPDSRTDIMGYCTSQWVSDYQWERVLAFRRGEASGLQGAVAARRPALVVWGTISNGQVRLEPAFRTTTYPRLPAGGPHRLELRAADGSLLAGFGFAGDAVDHVGDGRTFTFAIPLTDDAARRLDRIVVRSANGIGSAEQRARPASRPEPDAGDPTGDPQGNVRQRLAADDGTTGMGDPGIVVTRRGALTELRWNADAYPLGVVRDEGTGEILSFVRRPGDGVVAGDRATVRITFSDGVRSVTQRVPLR